MKWCWRIGESNGGIYLLVRKNRRGKSREQKGKGEELNRKCRRKL